MKKIVVLGGGTGISYLLRGLKDFPIDITAVISVSDNGRSTGKLRNEFYIPAVGDIRKVIYNMSPLPEEFKNVMEYRFNTYSDLNGHPMGNLLLTAMLTSSGSLLKSIDCMRYLLDVKHKILPLSEDFLTLMGETIDGDIVEGEDDLPKSGKQYKRIFYKECPHVLPEVISAIKDADLVILSMGSLYTSIIPHLICEDIQDILRETDAKVMYLCNAMTQPGETSGFTVSDHLKVIESYLGRGVLDTVVVSNSIISNEMLEKYSNQEQKDPVIIDAEEVSKMNIEMIQDNLLTIDEGTLKHNSLKLSSIIFSYLMR